MALSKLWTLEDLELEVRSSFNKISPDELQSNSIKRTLNISLLNNAGELNDSGVLDYIKTENISDAASSATNTVVIGGNFTNSSRTITKTSHGLTSADIGKRISYWDGITRAAIGEIESITNANSFVVTKALGGNAAGTLSYAVFSAHSTANIDVSGLKILKVREIFDSINGTLVPNPDRDFNALDRIPGNDYGVFYHFSGETVFLYKGRSISTWGTLTMDYFRQPDLLVNSTDYIDIKDQYVPKVIQEAKDILTQLLSNKGEIKQ